MVGGGWRWLEVVGGGWRWLEVVGGGWRWLEVVGGGWRWLVEPCFFGFFLYYIRWGFILVGWLVGLLVGWSVGRSVGCWPHPPASPDHRPRSDLHLPNGLGLVLVESWGEFWQVLGLFGLSGSAKGRLLLGVSSRG